MKTTQAGTPAGAEQTARRPGGNGAAWRPFNAAILVCLTMLTVCASVYFLQTAGGANGIHGFPLDDSWIHLQFARNLSDFGSFSYFRDQMATSGSTSPLFTFILALGFFVTRDEMTLAYVVGIISHAATVVLMYLLARRLFRGNPVLPSIAAGLVALEPRLVHASVSGMETGMFAALLLASQLAYVQRRHLALGITLGLALWARPEAIIFAGALAASLLYERYRRRGEKRRHGRPTPQQTVKAGQPSHPDDNTRSGASARTRRIAIAVGLSLVAGYLLWNLALSGSVLPNTYAAKSKYYSGDSPGYYAEVAAFLTRQVPVALLAGVGLLNLLVTVVRRRPAQLLVPVLCSAGMVVAYKVTLPHLYQEGRYLMPVLPFFVLLATDGLDVLFSRLETMTGLFSRPLPRVVTAGLVGAGLVFYSGQLCAGQATTYAGMCRYINDRQVATARWLHDHLPEDAVVATHDIGAIAFYSGRRVVDMVGLVSPEMVRNIGSFEGLRRFLAASHVTHLAVLRNWFEVANQNPLYQTDERVPEIMEVFSFDPARVRFVRQDVTRATMAATELMATGRWGEALAILEQVVRVEPECSRGHFLAAVAASSLGRRERAESALKAATQLQPDHWAARTMAAELRRRGGDVAGAISDLEGVLAANPVYGDAYRGLVRAYEEDLKDTVRAEEVRVRFRSIVQAKGGM